MKFKVDDIVAICPISSVRIPENVDVFVRVKHPDKDEPVVEKMRMDLCELLKLVKSAKGVKLTCEKKRKYRHIAVGVKNG
ncbi:MAG: hypothetical protein ACXADH_15495 [Candidatus Kariarchaeaceae archaeon]|jgi:hypothetical protein